MAKQQKHIPGAAKAGPRSRFLRAAAAAPARALIKMTGAGIIAAADFLARLTGLSSRLRPSLQAKPGGLRQKAGFSLVELLTIVSIIGVLAFVAMPVYTGYKTETVRRELLKKTETFFASATLCLMDSDSDLSGCDTKLKLGYYCPSGCEGPKTGKSGAGTGSDTLSLQFTIEGVSGCVSYFTGVCHDDATGKPKLPLVHCPGTACAATGETCMPYKNFHAKGVCNNASQASFPIKFCDSDNDCTTSGNTCSTKDGRLDSSDGLCKDVL